MNRTLSLIRAVLFNAIAATLVLSLMHSSAHAQSSLDTRGSVPFPGGSIIPGYDSRACDGTIEGAIRYNSATSCAEYCEGSAWTCPATSGLSGPSGCPNTGDLCADGTVFAGYHPITQEHLFISPTDQGTTSAWKTSTGTNDIATDSTYDGRANTNQVPNSTTFPAFKLCKDLGTGGHSDWYLPSQVELYYLWAVRETIEAGGNITNFQNTPYWSSTEFNTSSACYQHFTNGAQALSNKTNGYMVRCVRR